MAPVLVFCAMSWRLCLLSVKMYTMLGAFSGEGEGRGKGKERKREEEGRKINLHVGHGLLHFYTTS